MQDIFIFILLLVAIGAIIPITIVAMTLRARRERMTPQVLAPVLARLEAIETRLATLERIATDPAERVARDIERLREPTEGGRP